MPIVTLMRRGRADDLLVRLEQMVTEAHRRGLGSLAYVLEAALSDAHLVQAQLEKDVHRFRAVVSAETSAPD